MFFTYDLVSRGGSECWGMYNSNTGNGYGGGYKNPCIRSGTIKALGDLPTTWYNYVTASAGIIKNASASDDIGTTEKATESICPKGWTLPNNTQIGSNRDIANFSPILGGYYSNGTLYDENTFGGWWGSEAYDGATRYYLYYNGSSLYTDYYSRRNGRYVRCVQKLADS